MFERLNDSARLYIILILMDCFIELSWCVGVVEGFKFVSSMCF